MLTTPNGTNRLFNVLFNARQNGSFNGVLKTARGCLSPVNFIGNFQHWSPLDYLDGVTDVRRTTTKIYRDVPVTGSRNRNSRRESLVMTAEILKPTTTTVALKVMIISKHYVALVGTIDYDHITLMQKLP